MTSGDILGDHAQRSLTGLAFAAAGYGLMTCGDVVVKSMGDDWPGTAIAALRYVFGALGIATLLWVREGRASFHAPMPLIQWGRGACVALGSTCFFLALNFISVAEATVIQFVSPVFVALLSAVFLKEHAGKAVWLASAIAFAGVVLVIRPNLAHVGLAGLLPLGTAFLMAGLVIFNRKSAGTMTALQAQMLVSACATPIILLVTFGGHISGVPALHVPMPTMAVVAKCAIVACTASSAHALIYMATERVSAATMAPVTYVQLLVAIVLGAALFGHWPDSAMWAGAALIIAAGLILWNSARKGASR